MSKIGVRRSIGSVCACLALLMALAVTPRPGFAGQPPTAPEGFVPAGDLPAREELPAAPLLITAYAVAWVLVFGYLWSIWQRLGRVEREIQDLSRRVEAGGRR